MPSHLLSVDGYMKAKPFHNSCSLMPNHDICPVAKYSGAVVDIEWDTSSHNYEQRQKERFNEATK